MTVILLTERKKTRERTLEKAKNLYIECDIFMGRGGMGIIQT